MWLHNALKCMAAVCSTVMLAACTTSNDTPADVDPEVAAMYAPVKSEPHRIPGVSVTKIDPRYLRQQVETPQKVKARPGTIVVDPDNRFLYHVEGGGMSMRYGIGVGKAGFSWSGTATIKDKQEWPKWFPPKEMQEREFRARWYADGMEGGIRNPLGARALYLYQGNKDTLYRIHGTDAPWTIGQNVSRGCIRMHNQHVIELYDKVRVGAKVLATWKAYRAKRVS